LLKRLLGNARCSRIYYTERSDNIRMLAVSRELFITLVHDLLESLTEFISFKPTITIPFTTYSFTSVTWITPKKYDKLKAQLQRDREHNLFVMEGPVIATRFINNLSSILSTLVVCLDIEAYEFDHRLILEIGITTIRIQKNPTTDEILFLDQPIVQHYLIKENVKIFNGKHVINRKHQFAFGDSIELSMEEVSQSLYYLLSCPQTVLVGHNILSDIGFLSKAGYPIPPHIRIQVLDTQLMFAQLRRQPSERASLEKCMTSLGITEKHHSSHLHNAGNDAWYTMIVFLLLIGTRPNWQEWYKGSVLNNKYVLQSVCT
jgi:hypothetical protein